MKEYSYHGEKVKNGTEIVVIEEKLYYENKDSKTFTSFETTVKGLPNIHNLAAHELGERWIYNPLELKKDNSILYKINTDFSIKITFDKYNYFKKRGHLNKIHVFLKTEKGLLALKRLTKKLYRKEKNFKSDVLNQIKMIEDTFDSQKLSYWVDQVRQTREDVMFGTDYAKINYFLALKEVLKDKPHYPNKKQRKEARRNLAQKKGSRRENS